MTNQADTGAHRSFRIPGLLLACAAGLVIALVDSNPGWDDTGVTAAMILGASAIFGALRPGRAISSALAVGVWLPAIEIWSTGNFGSLLALVLALAGSTAGAVAAKAMGESDV